MTVTVLLGAGVADWATISALATAAGTLVLAAATFASVRSANRAARVAELALLEGLRPVLMASRMEDPPQKVGFVDGKWLLTEGGQAAAEVADGVVYLAMALRNVGTGIALLHGWRFYPEWRPGEQPQPELDSFRRLTRDIYVAAGDVGFWQGAFRDPEDPAFAEARACIEAREEWMVDLLYGDHEGGQRVITRFAARPREDGKWLASSSRYWHIDRDDPR